MGGKIEISYKRYVLHIILQPLRTNHLPFGEFLVDNLGRSVSDVVHTSENQAICSCALSASVTPSRSDICFTS